MIPLAIRKSISYLLDTYVLDNVIVADYLESELGWYTKGDPSCIRRSAIPNYDLPEKSYDIFPRDAYYFNPYYSGVIWATTDGEVKHHSQAYYQIGQRAPDESIDASVVFRVDPNQNANGIPNLAKVIRQFFSPTRDDGTHLRGYILGHAACVWYASHSIGSGYLPNPPARYLVIDRSQPFVPTQACVLYFVRKPLPAGSPDFSYTLTLNGQYTCHISFPSTVNGYPQPTSEGIDFGTLPQLEQGDTIYSSNVANVAYRFEVYFDQGRFYFKVKADNYSQTRLLSVIPPAGFTEITSLSLASNATITREVIGSVSDNFMYPEDSGTDYLANVVGSFTEATNPDSNNTVPHPTVNTLPKLWDGHPTVSSGLTALSPDPISTGEFTLFMVAFWHLEPVNTDTTDVFNLNSGKIAFSYTTGNDFEITVGSTTVVVPRAKLQSRFVMPLVITRASSGAIQVFINNELVAEDATGNTDDLSGSGTLKYHGNVSGQSWFTSSEIAFFNKELPEFDRQMANELAGGKAESLAGVVGYYKDHITGTAVLLDPTTGEALSVVPLQAGMFQFLVDTSFSYGVIMFDSSDLTGAGKVLSGSPLPASGFTAPDGSTGTHKVTGATYQGGSYFSTIVRVYRQDTMVMLAEVTSSASDGSYIAKFNYSGTVVCAVDHTSHIEVIPNRTPVTV